MDVEEKKSRAVHEQETREAQQGKRKRHGPERQKRSKAVHGQENRNVQQERGVVNRRSEEPSKC